MRNIMAIAFGLLLLMPAVTATGNSNIANATVAENMVGQAMTNAAFVQSSNADTNLAGNLINAIQITNISAVDNILTGSKPGDKTFFYQSVDQSISDTGNNNVDIQNVGGPDISFAESVAVDTDFTGADLGLTAVDNTLTDSAIIQTICQSETVEGNSNMGIQSVGSPDISIVESVMVDTDFAGADLGLIAVDNTLTDSVASQIINQSEKIDGNSNVGTQSVGSPKISIDESVVVDASFTGVGLGLIAADNTLTDSAVGQIIDQSERVVGNSNAGTQNVGSPDISLGGSVVTGIGFIGSGLGLISVGNTLTDSAISQMISQSEKIDGNSNVGTQSVGSPLVNIDSSVVVDTDFAGVDLGLIAVDNILTDSAVSQMIRQSEKIDGNSNMDTQSVGSPNISIADSIAVGTGFTGVDLGLIAVDNTLTDSVASQIIGQDDTDTGNIDEVTQIANAIMAEDILTEVGALQRIDENVLILGNANTVSHDGALTNTANIVTGGNIIQQTEISTSI